MVFDLSPTKPRVQKKETIHHLYININLKLEDTFFYIYVLQDTYNSVWRILLVMIVGVVWKI